MYAAGEGYALLSVSLVRKIAVNAVADARGGCLDGVAREVDVARGGLNLGVTKKLADHGQPLAERQRTRGEGVA